jgi:hypothetical protein
MRLDAKGSSAVSAFMYADKHTVLCDKAEAGDLESFHNAVLGLGCLKRNEVAYGYHMPPSSSSEDGSRKYDLQNVHDVKIPRVMSAMEKILKGEFAQNVPVNGVPMVPMWGAPQAHAFPLYQAQQLQQLQQQQQVQQQMYQMQQQQMYDHKPQQPPMYDHKPQQPPMYDHKPQQPPMYEHKPQQPPMYDHKPQQPPMYEHKPQQQPMYDHKPQQQQSQQRNNIMYS